MKKFLVTVVVLIGISILFLLIPQNTDNNVLIEDNMENVIVTLKTNFGDIKMELIPSEAPNTVDNFVKLSKEGFYNGTRFHRVIKDFMIQGGDPLSKDESQRQFWGTGGPGYKFDDENSNIELVQGVIAMANSGPNTNGSQFFIITAEATPWLQGMHTGFGKVIEGLDIIMKIGEVETSTSDQPLEDVILEEVVVE
jgi:cyclophilin family peptidyl-prolyl cis-trans isomerase